MKKVTIRWKKVQQATGYLMYFSEQSNPLESIGSSVDPFTVILNRADDAIINFAVQAFQTQVVNGIERRVFGNCAVVQIDLATGSEQKFKKVNIKSVLIEPQV